MRQKFINVTASVERYDEVSQIILDQIPSHIFIGLVPDWGSVLEADHIKNVWKKVGCDLVWKTSARRKETSLEEELRLRAREQTWSCPSTFYVLCSMFYVITAMTTSASFLNEIISKQGTTSWLTWPDLSVDLLQTAGAGVWWMWGGNNVEIQ